MRTCDQRFQFRKIDIDDFIINSILITLEFYISIPSSFCFQKGFRYFIGRENGSCCTKFCTHIGNSCSFWYG